MLKLWNKLQQYRGSFSDSSREKGLIVGLLFSLSALIFFVDKSSTVALLVTVIAVLYSAYQLSVFYTSRNKN
jgi:hypothetical protein